MWPKGTSQWQRTRVLIVSADRTRRAQLRSAWPDADIVLAATPLEVIGSLERYGPAISTVVLSDVVGAATCVDLAEFLEENYPFVRVNRVRAEPADPRSIAARELLASSPRSGARIRRA